MHVLIIGPLTPRLRESLSKSLTEKISPGNQTNSEDLKEQKDQMLTISLQTRKAFKDCFCQMRDSISPLDKLAHLMTGLKVITNAVIILFFSCGEREVRV